MTLLSKLITSPSSINRALSEPIRKPLSGNQQAARPNITTPRGLIVDRTTSEQLGNATKTVVAGASGQIQKD